MKLFIEVESKYDYDTEMKESLADAILQEMGAGVMSVNIKEDIRELPEFENGDDLQLNDAILGAKDE